jgi:acetylornithine deacetylase/succinyl-diaminopimelate desuccinylase-like protein
MDRARRASRNSIKSVVLSLSKPASMFQLSVLCEEAPFDRLRATVNGRTTLRHTIAALITLSFTAPAAAQTTSNPWHAKGRELFADIIAIPSVTDRTDEVKRLTAYLKARFEAGGIKDIIVKDHDGTQSMIVRWSAETKGKGKKAAKDKPKPILLLGHMDVVEAKREDWSRDPFKLIEEDGYLYGRGTLDMKNGIAAITNALLWLKAEGYKPKRDIIVFFSGDEETAGNGARRASTEWRSLIDADFALNADAGGGAFLKDGPLLGFGLQTSEKMYQDFTFTVRNPGGHSSRPRADNAIYELSTALKKLEAHRFTPAMTETTRAYLQFRQKQEQGALGDAMRRWLANKDDGAAADIIEADKSEIGTTRTRCVATRLEGGHANNALPQMARATVNCRILPGSTAQEVQAELQRVTGDGVVIEPIDVARPSPPSPLRADVVKAYTDTVRKRHAKAEIVPQMSQGATDALFFRSEGIPVYGVDGSWIVIPDDERAHGKDERIPVKSFYETLDHWRDLVKALAG